MISSCYIKHYLHQESSTSMGPRSKNWCVLFYSCILFDFLRHRCVTWSLRIHILVSFKPVFPTLVIFGILSNTFVRQTWKLPGTPYFRPYSAQQVDLENPAVRRVVASKGFTAEGALIIIDKWYHMISIVTQNLSVCTRSRLSTAVGVSLQLV